MLLLIIITNEEIEIPAKGKGNKANGNVEAACNSTMRISRRQSLYM